jgi:hypothetical protein
MTMTCSAAQLAANKSNAQMSTGPKTEEGKRISRANSCKHGLTGEGIVLPNEDVEEIERRREALEDDLKPKSALARELLGRVALLFVRLDRSAKQEAKALTMKMRNATSDFEDARMAEADHLISWIAHEPVTNNRRLKRTPEGIKRLIIALEGLRSDLTRQPSYRWDYAHCDQLHSYLGMRREEMPITRIRALTDAIHGKFDHIDPTEIPESEIMAKRRWAIRQMVELLEGEIAKVKTLLETFDLSIIAIDRAEAADRAMFDTSKEGILARKYEAACERAMYKALKELREMQADSAQTDIEEEVADEPAEELGSFSPAAPEPINTEADINPTTQKRRPNLEKLVQKGRRKASQA